MDEAGSDPALASRQPANTLTILIADDEPSIRTGLTKIIGLDDAMTVVAVATNADEAITMARDSQPMVALLDINMPGGGGPRATAGIREASPRTMVIAHTIHDDRAAVMEMVRAGAVGYIVKGASADEILSTLQRAGAGKSSLSPEVISTVVSELAAMVHFQEQQAAARRAEVARARRLVAGEGLGLAVEPVIDLQTGAPVGVEVRPFLVDQPGRDVEEELVASEAVGYRVELENALVRRALAEVGPRLAGSYVGIRVSAATVVSRAFSQLEPPTGTRLMVVLDGARESADGRELQEVLGRLRHRGAILAVGGLGGGAAAFGFALALRPEVLKLDRRLLAALDLDPAAQALVGGMATFARGLGANLQVDGIASAEAADAARQAGARLGQGPYFTNLRTGPDGAPAPADGPGG